MSAADTGAPTPTGHASTAASPAVQHRAPRIWVWFLIGFALLAAGSILLGLVFGSAMAPAGDELGFVENGREWFVVLGGVVVVLGGFLIQVAIIAKGVELGRRASPESDASGIQRVDLPVPVAEAAPVGNRQQVVARVEEILTNHFDNVEYASDGFTLRKGSARGFVEVYSPAGNGHREPPTFVRITVPLLQQVPETPELHRHIAFSAGDHRFGTLALVPDHEHGTCVFFKHTLLGDFLDDDELGYALGGMLEDADDLDDELQRKFGGVRFHED